MTPVNADGLFIAEGFSAFVVIWLVLAAVGFGGFVLGVIALIDVARTPLERFGPWCDNTRRRRPSVLGRWTKASTGVAAVLGAAAHRTR